MRQLRGFIFREIERIADRIKRARPKVVIATSGTAESLAAVCHGLYKTKGSRAARIQDANATDRKTAGATASRRNARQLSGVGPRRAEIIVPGAAVYLGLLERCQLQGFRYSPLGLRDGLLAQMAAEYDRSTRSGKQIESERWDSIRAAVAHYRVDMEHALNVRASAMQLVRRAESPSTVCRLNMRNGFPPLPCSTKWAIT